MKTKLLLLASFVVLSFTLKTDKVAYVIFDANGKKSSYKKMLKDSREADIVLFGEMHDNPICHWLQFELTSDLYETKKENLILGAEMFEADNQIILNEYLNDKISIKSFEKEARLWPNYNTDYKPLVEFAKEKKLPFIATNIPRRYASIVYKKGMEKLNGLEDEAKQWIAPLPIKYDPELKCYKDIVKMAGGHGGENLPKSQAIKDATMAHFILKNWKSGKQFIHYNGSFHSNNFESIVWYIKQQQPNLKILTIASVQQENTDTLTTDYKNLANYILCTPLSMTKTH